MSSPLVAAPTAEHHPSGFGIGHTRPRLSWRFTSPDTNLRGWIQSGYDIEVRTAGSPAHSNIYYVESEASVLVPWPGPSLKAREAVLVRVRCYGRALGVAGGDGKTRATEWSPFATYEVAFLEKETWSAKLITSSANDREPSGPLRPLRFRKIFLLPAGNEGAKARLYITCLGVYEAYVNGVRVGDHVMAPGWTSYNHRINYQTFDVGALLLHGKENVLGVEVAEGWYATRLGPGAGRRFCYGGRELAVLAQLEITTSSGNRITVVSDHSWRARLSAIKRSEIYDGEIYDAREENLGWNSSIYGFNDSAWADVKHLPFPVGILIATDAPPVRVTQEVAAIKITRSSSSSFIIDFGQNLVGVVRVGSIQGQPGQRVSFLHAEVLEDGQLGTRPLRTAKCTDTIILSGEELRNWSPKYTFHGFRYMQVDGWPQFSGAGIPSKENFTALVIHSDMPRRGWFTCSNPQVNQLHQNVVWSMRGNFLSVPTDCPQRDERLGWTGDIQVFSPSANFLYDTFGLLSGWLKDVAVEQFEEARGGLPGLVTPDVIPDILPKVPMAVWHDVTVLTPWELYRTSGDKEVLERQFPSMRAWIDHDIPRGPDGLWLSGSPQFGDWLDPAAPPDNPGAGRTDAVLVADAYLVHVTTIFSSVCSTLGRSDHAARYTEDAKRLKRAFQTKYITSNGDITGNSETGIALALRFGLFSDASQIAVAAANLLNLVHSSEFCIATGFAGTPIISHALTAAGQTQVAYRMLLEQKCPSWLYPVTMGATTVWERWDSMLPDGSINPGQMTSFNHYALGSVVDWLHCTVGGISPLEPGWKALKVCPVPGGDLTNAEVRFESPYGWAECRWRVVGDKFEMHLSIPPNSRAWVHLPRSPSGDSTYGREKGIWVGSGEYTFGCTYAPQI